MPDSTYGSKVYRKQGGDELVVAAGGKITHEDGGAYMEPVAVVTDDTTVTAAESGKTFLVGAADKVITLPATAAGLRYRFVLQAAGLSAGTGLSISPQAADAIHGDGLTSVDDKDLILAGSGDAEGDMVELLGDGVDGWYIVAVVGTWSKQS